MVSFVGKQRERRRRLWHETKWDGEPGLAAALRRLVYQFQGAAQLGRRDEPAYIMPENPKCPVCSAPMKEHQINRGGPGARTHLICPDPAAAGE